jgi:photosystem II stability/assembly factor-like uncharacterized protein
MILGLLGAVLLAGCSADSGDPYAALTPGPTPTARPGAYVWVCGAPDLIIGSADGGAAWQVRSRGADGDIMTGDLWGIAFGDTGHGWAVRRGVTRPRATLLATTDAGRTWSEQSPGTRNGRLLAVAATDASHVWAVGEQRLKGFGDQGKGLVLASADGGATWTRQQLPAGFVPFRVAFADARHGWLIAGGASHFDYHVLATSDGGRHWRLSYSAPKGIALFGVAAVGPDRCWVVGYGEHPQTGFAARTTDGGRHWDPSASVTPKGLLAVSFPDARHGWAVGYDGTVISTTDGGATWQVQDTGGGYGLRQVSFSDRSHGWALIGHLALLTTSDGGRSWSVVRPVNTRDYLTGLTTVDSPLATAQ